MKKSLKTANVKGAGGGIVSAIPLAILAILLAFPLVMSLISCSSMQNRAQYQSWLGAEMRSGVAEGKVTTDRLSLMPEDMPALVNMEGTVGLGSGGQVIFEGPSGDKLLFTPSVAPYLIEGTFQFDTEAGTYAFDGSDIDTVGTFTYLEGADAVAALQSQEGISADILQRIAWNAPSVAAANGEQLAVGYLSFTPESAESDGVPSSATFFNEVGTANSLILLADSEGRMYVYSPLWNTYGTYLPLG